MNGTLGIERAGPAMSLQDLGRPGLIAQGLSVGGAADRLALLEASALLDLKTVSPAIEMGGVGGVFKTDMLTRFALTGAPMQAAIDGVAIAWNASHLLHPGQRLAIGGALGGIYGYLTFAGGVRGASWKGSISTHITAGIGTLLRDGETLPLGPDPAPETPAMKIAGRQRFSGGAVRVMPGPQSDLFNAGLRTRFFATTFKRGPQANRQGVQVLHDGAPFSCDARNGLASDFIVPGDVQMTGDGAPFVLLCECQTIGGYPRIGTVLPADLPILAQAPLNIEIRFVPVSVEEADRLFRTEADKLRDLRPQTEPLVRDPHDIRDLLTYQLIGGVTSGDDLERT